MAESSESDHFSDIFDSTSDLTHVIGQLDRKLKISEHGDDEEEDSKVDDKNRNKSRTQPQQLNHDNDDHGDAISIDAASIITTNVAAAGDGGLEGTSKEDQTEQKLLNKDPSFPRHSLSTTHSSVSTSSSSSSLNDDIVPPPVAVQGMCVLQRAAMEILESEGSYVMDLQQVIEGYLHDWKERACLKLDELETLFGNIEQLYAVNAQLNDRLKETRGDVSQIAHCFLSLKDEFIVYTTYCTRYPDAIALLTRLLQSTHTNALLTSTQKVLRHTLPLGSYLLKPVQRILKYHLLLDNLRKHCNVPEVNEAHEQMLKVARDIDQMKKALEQKGRVRQLCGILDGWMGPELTVLGDLRHEGVLFNNNKPREVFLFDTMLIIAKPKEDRRLQFKSYIHRKDIMLVEQISGEPCSFFVIPYSDPRNQIKFVARNRNQKRLWAHHIKTVMLEDLNIPNRAKDLVFQLGDEEDATPEKSNKKWGQAATTPEYLERRHRYRRSEIKERSAAVKAKRAAAKEAEAAAATLSSSQSQHFEACCADGKNCNCAIVKEQLKKDLAKKMFESGDEGLMEGTSTSSLNTSSAINKYTSNAMPKRIMNLKKTRSKTVPSSVFYRTLADLTTGSDRGGEEETSSMADSQEQLLTRSVSKEEGGGGAEADGEGELEEDGEKRKIRSKEGSNSAARRISSGKKSTPFRASDSHLNYNQTTVATTSSSKEGGSGNQQLMRSNTISSSSGTEKLSNSNRSSGGNKVKKNNSSLYKSWRSVKEDQSESKASFQHLPGSSNLGERIANVDYADPQRLFCMKTINSSSSTTSSTITTAIKTLTTTTTTKSATRERDSVVSFTSSSDSVDETMKMRGEPTLQTENIFFDRIGDDSYYEEDIERCLEDASLFRDSAIYSDDNDQRRVTVSSKRSEGGGETPPPVPYKPKHVTELQRKRLQELKERRRVTGNSGSGGEGATAIGEQPR